MEIWTPILRPGRKPRYIQLAEAIAADIERGRLIAGDRLPPQRKLADLLGIDFTTVSRGYARAKSQGIVEARVGQGTFVAASDAQAGQPEQRRQGDIDLTMNLAPEPTDPALLRRMEAGLSAVSANMVDLLRYQHTAGGQVDKEAASSWLSMRGMIPSLDRVLVTPGAHPTMLAILMGLTKPGDTVLCEDITYPGFLGLAARMELRVVGVPMDADGILADALEAAITQYAPKLLYLNPTLHNPTTRTVPTARRQDIATIMLRHNLPLIEDDAYGFIPPNPPAPIATFAPKLVWHIGGLAKCIGAGLRLAYSVAPSRAAALDLAGHLKAISVMPSPLATALTTRWITDGTADSIRRFIRVETAARQAIARDILGDYAFEADETAFNIWLQLPEGRSRADVISRMTGTGLGLMPADAFVAGGTPPEAIRVCLGGPIGQDKLHQALTQLAQVLSYRY